mgnify:CR=1 FL=1
MALTKVDTSMVESTGAFGRRNILINGDYGIYQRAQQVTGIGASSGYFTADRWVINPSTEGRLTMTAGTADAPAESNVTTSLKLACTTADTSVGGDQFCLLDQRIEGQNLQHVKKGTSGAKQLTASFWVKGNASATYVAELYDNDNARQVSKSFSVTSSWSKVELTFPADTTGAFGNDNGSSLFFQIWLLGGSIFTSGTLSETWTSVTNANRAVGISNFFSSTSNEFYITAVQLEVGDVATEFEHLTFDEQSSLCKRYYQQYSGFHAMPMWTYGRNNGSMQFVLEKEMRTEPTSSYSGTLGSLQSNSHCGIYESDWVTISSLTFSSTAAASNPKMMRFDSSHPSNAFASNNVAVGFYAGDDFYLIFDAEL